MTDAEILALINSDPDALERANARVVAGGALSSNTNSFIKLLPYTRQGV